MIRFNNVTKDFGGEIPALDDVSFEIETGEFVFLTGHSGSGKSTLLKIITKEYVPTSGDVDFDDTPLSKIKGGKVHKHRRQIGVVFQDYRLLPELNIWENIALPLEIMGKKNQEIEERVTDLLELVQLTDKAHDFPSQLSGGESQRVGVARALATAPTVLLADEPTGNLDPQNTMMIAKLFNRINELGTTIIFATHDPTVLNALSHRRLNLSKGKIDEDTKSKKEKHVKPAKAEVEVEEVVDHTTHHTEPEKLIDESEAPPKEKKVKRSLPKIHFAFPFRKKKSKKEDSEEKVTEEIETVLETDESTSENDENPDLKEMMVQIESLEETKDEKKS